jgi:lambda repressor-like predicted transcriptional regulator
MTAKEYLSQTWRINRMIDAKLEQVQALRDLSAKAGMTLSKAPNSGTRNVHRMEDVIVKILDIESEINADIESLLTLRKDITAAIKGLPNPDHKVLLELRYLCFKPWAEIASTMNYGRKYVFRLHDIALKQIQAPGQEDTLTT